VSDDTLRSLSKAQLLDFIKKKAEVEKKMLYDIARALTSEVEQSTLPKMIESLSQGIEGKRVKLQQLEDQRKNLNLEISGLETAQAVHQQKLKKRKGQLHDSELEVKTLRDKLIEIQKRVTPELIKALNKQLDKSDGKQDNLTAMLVAFCSLVNMSQSRLSDVKEDFKNHSQITEKMINAMATNFQVDNDVVERQREALKEVQKSFTDPTLQDNRICQPYAALLAWAQNYPFFLKHNQQMLKVVSDIQKAQKELDQKVEKIQNIKNVLASLDKEGYYELFRTQIAEDTALIEKY
jgi:chromosome segregation ATPase